MAGASSSSISSPPGLIGPGRVVLVVGPSGAGKDTILREVQSRLAANPGFVFPRRLVTRAPSADEDNQALSMEEFETLVRQGRIALHWHAHGLRYGLAATADDAVRGGCSIVVNVSRHAVAAARGRYACALVYIDAPPPVRAERLAARNREHVEDIAARLERIVAGFDASQADLVIYNDGSVAEASQRFVSWLMGTRGGG